MLTTYCPDSFLWFNTVQDPKPGNGATTIDKSTPVIRIKDSSHLLTNGPTLWRTRDRLLRLSRVIIDCVSFTT